MMLSDFRIVPLREANSRRTIQIEHLAPKLARFLYQEMSLEGGEVVLPPGMDDRSAELVTIRIYGTPLQFQHLAVRLRTQNVDELNLLADELDKYSE